MAKIFISHSSSDKKFVQSLAEDISSLGHTPWVDEWEIKVGECIVSRVEHGIKESDYIIIVLSKKSVTSGWVEKEWKTKYWEEIERSRNIILPVLIDDCEIPTLLKTKKYADFRKNYSVALVELMGAISPVIKRKSDFEIPELEKSCKNDIHEITNLITKIQSGTTPLSQCIAEALKIAKNSNAPSLESLCVGELTGWSQTRLKDFHPKYRNVQLYLSIGAQINMQYFDKPYNALDYIKNDSENFFPIKFLFTQSISVLESEAPPDPTKGILCLTMKAKNFVTYSDLMKNNIGNTDISNHDIPFYMYTSGYAYKELFGAIKEELTKQLIDLLPTL